MSAYVRPPKGPIFANRRKVWRKTSRTFVIRVLLTVLILSVALKQGVISSHAFVKTTSETITDVANARSFGEGRSYPSEFGEKFSYRNAVF